MAVFTVTELGFSYEADVPVIADLSTMVAQGDFLAIIGPNGSGKSTLLKLLLGTLRPERGTVLFENRAAVKWDRRELARRIGVVAQLEELPFPITVREFVAMGRYPHLGAWQRERELDRAIIEEALQLCDVSTLAHRHIQQVSGGERQRVRVARALAQQPSVLVLDEPTTALDIGHEVAMFELLARLRSTAGMTVVTA